MTDGKIHQPDGIPSDVVASRCSACFARAPVTTVMILPLRLSLRGITLAKASGPAAVTGGCIPPPNARGPSFWRSEAKPKLCQSLPVHALARRSSGQTIGQQAALPEKARGRPHTKCKRTAPNRALEADAAPPAPKVDCERYGTWRASESWSIWSCPSRFIPSKIAGACSFPRPQA